MTLRRSRGVRWKCRKCRYQVLASRLLLIACVCICRTRDVYSEVFGLKELMTDMERRILDAIRSRHSEQDYDAILDDNDLLSNIYDIETRGQTTDAPKPTKSGSQPVESQRQRLASQKSTIATERLQELKEALRVDVDSVLSKLGTKFSIELARHREEMNEMMTKTGESVVKRLMAGHWDIIHDQVCLFILHP